MVSGQHVIVHHCSYCFLLGFLGVLWDDKWHPQPTSETTHLDRSWRRQIEITTMTERVLVPNSVWKKPCEDACEGFGLCVFGCFIHWESWRALADQLGVESIFWGRVVIFEDIEAKVFDRTWIIIHEPSFLGIVPCGYLLCVIGFIGCLNCF